MSTPTVKDFMTEMPHTINEDLSLKKAMEMMHEYGCRHLPVLHGGKVVGILSDRDIKLVSTFSNSEELPVSEAMTEDPYSVSPDTPLKVVAEEMNKHRFGSAVVVGANNKPVGIFTVSNALEALISRL